MKFDFTSEIDLNKKSYYTYRKYQAVLYFLALILAIYFSLIILFPFQNFNFSFTMLTANKGNALNPRLADGTLIKDGQIPKNNDIYFDASLLGSYSKARITIDANAKSALPDQTSVKLKKSFQAFLYPEGSPVGFKDGTLLNSNNNYYLISDGQLRKFKDNSVIPALGLSSGAFITANSDDLKYNSAGDDITDSQNYPDSSIFKINDNYYLLENQTLKKFVSQNAYLSNYNENQAISKDETFLAKYPISPELLGFSDGTLASYGTSAYILSSGKYYPIGDPVTFVNQGFNWNDIISISGDELSLYQKADKLFTLTSAHPDGTIFMTTEDSAYYMIKNGQKDLLPTKNIALSWLKKNPILVSRQSLDTVLNCQLQKSGSAYFCEIPLDKLDNLPGAYYQFRLNSTASSKIDNLNVLYTRDKTLSNLKLTLRDLILRIKGKYGIQTSNNQPQ